MRDSQLQLDALNNDGLASLGIEFQPLDIVQVPAGNAQETGAIRESDGVDVANVVLADLARIQAVFVDLLQAGVAAARTAIGALPDGHVVYPLTWP